MISFGQTLRRLRDKKGLTQSQVGDYCGVSAKSISRYENETAEPDFKLILKMATLFGVDCNYLLGYKTKIDKSSHIDHRIELLLKRFSEQEKGFIENTLSNYLDYMHLNDEDDQSDVMYVSENKK